MTIGIVFKCIDGAVLCADTQLTIPFPYSSKYPGLKIFGFPELQSQPFFTYAGEVAFSTMCINRLADRIAQAEKAGREVAETLTGECKKIHNEYSRLYPDGRLTLGLLLVLRRPDASLALYKIIAPSVAPLLSPPFECIGVGTPVAQSVIVPLCSPSITTNEAARIGYYALSQAKQFVEGCGGQTEMVTFREGEARRGYYDIVEEHTVIFERHLSELTKRLKGIRKGQIQKWRGEAHGWLKKKEDVP
jgi:20S proteasome alpha/beta subunit